MKRIGLIATLIVMLAADIAAAQRQKFGSWETSTAGQSFVYALTQNDSGHVLGQWCDLTASSCLWLLGIRTSCNEGETYPILVNSNAGSASLRLHCAGPLANVPGVYRYVFADFDSIDGLVAKSAKIGVALPLEGDQFRVIRFDLNGAPAAVSLMRNAAEGRTRPARQGTRDEKL
jgi:hypothetical protein